MYNEIHKLMDMHIDIMCKIDEELDTTCDKLKESYSSIVPEDMNSFLYMLSLVQSDLQDFTRTYADLRHSMEHAVESGLDFNLTALNEERYVAQLKDYLHLGMRQLVKAYLTVNNLENIVEEYFKVDEDKS